MPPASELELVASGQKKKKNSLCLLRTFLILISSHFSDSFAYGKLTSKKRYFVFLPSELLSNNLKYFIYREREWEATPEQLPHSGLWRRHSFGTGRQEWGRWRMKLGKGVFKLGVSRDWEAETRGKSQDLVSKEKWQEGQFGNISWWWDCNKRQRSYLSAWRGWECKKQWRSSRRLGVCQLSALSLNDQCPTKYLPKCYSSSVSFSWRNPKPGVFQKLLF